jgi:hypothetical protein
MGAISRCFGGIVVAGAMSLALCGCAYRLYAPSLPFQSTLTPVAESPEQYAVRVQGRDYPVAADSRVTFEYPAVRRGCGVYLFDLVPINRGRDPLKAKTISVTNGLKVLKSFSVEDISKWPLDSSGYHVLSLTGAR